jgi:hypothetical protein
MGRYASIASENMRGPAPGIGHYRIAEKSTLALPAHPNIGKINNRIPARRKAQQ